MDFYDDKWFERKEMFASERSKDLKRKAFFEVSIQDLSHEKQSNQLELSYAAKNAQYERLFVPFYPGELLDDPDSWMSEKIETRFGYYALLAIGTEKNIFLKRSLVEDTEYPDFSKQNIGSCVGLIPMFAFVVEVLDFVFSFNQFFYGAQNTDLRLRLRISGLKGRVLFGDLPFSVGIPNPVYRSLKDSRSVETEISLHELRSDFQAVVLVIAKDLFSDFKRSSPSPDMFGSEHPDFYSFPADDPTLVKLINSIVNQQFSFWKPDRFVAG